MIKISTTS